MQLDAMRFSGNYCNTILLYCEARQHCEKSRQDFAKIIRFAHGVRTGRLSQCSELRSHVASMKIWVSKPYIEVLFCSAFHTRSGV